MADDYVDIKDVTTENWRSYCDELPEREWREAMYFSPYIRLGYSDGPAGVYRGEPWNQRTCTVTGLEGLTFDAHFIVREGPDRVPHFYQFNGAVTLAEFNALAAIIIPRIGVCGMGYGSGFAGRSAPFRYDERATLHHVCTRPGWFENPDPVERDGT